MTEEEFNYDEVSQKMRVLLFALVVALFLAGGGLLYGITVGLAAWLKG